MASNMGQTEQEAKNHKSGETSPEEGRSVFSGRQRSNTETTLVSSVADDTRSVSTTNHPGAPFNTPINGSVVGEPVDPNALLARVVTIKPDNASSVHGDATNAAEAGKTDVVKTSAYGGVLEKTIWQSEAEESAAIGLARLAQLAKDANAHDPSKSVEQYYSVYLSKAIKEAAVEFDAMTLQ